MDELFSVITSYLARAGYEVLDGDAAKFVIRDKMKDEDFEITISECTLNCRMARRNWSPR